MFLSLLITIPAAQVTPQLPGGEWSLLLGDTTTPPPESAKKDREVLNQQGQTVDTKARELTEDEVFCTEAAARAGVEFENPSDVEPLVVLRCFGPEAQPDAPALGTHKSNKFR